MAVVNNRTQSLAYVKQVPAFPFSRLFLKVRDRVYSLNLYFLSEVLTEAIPGGSTIWPSFKAYSRGIKMQGAQAGGGWGARSGSPLIKENMR